MSDPIVGIDLGTSTTVVAHTGPSGTQVLADESGYKIQPSVVSFHPNGGVVVGAAAKQRKVIDPQNTIYSVKRLIGRAFSSPEVATARARMPYQLKEGPNELPLIVTRGGEFAVPEISAIVLDNARNVATSRLGTPVSRAVVTVPASFNDAQRSATATAGAIAGLTVVRVLNEPTAAALAYGNARSLRQVIAVYDFGGGTFDITILKLHDQVYEVLGTAGDTFLGGDDLDERLVDKMVMKFLAENRIDLRTNEVSMMRLRAVAEQTKIELSRRSRAVVRIDEIAYGPKGKPLDLQIEITRDELVSQIADIIDRTFPVCKEALTYANLGIDGIDDVILVGGTTKIPHVRDQVSKFFGKAPRADVNPEEAVAVGAALQASSLERILARKTPRRSSAAMPVVPVSVEQVGDDDLSAVVDIAVQSVPTEIPVYNKAVRKTAGYPTVLRKPEPARPETEYSLPRAGTREAVFEERTPTPGAPAIGRLRPASPRTTTTGVAAVAPPPRPPAARPSTAPPAPPPAPPQAPPPTPPQAQSPWSSADDFQTNAGDPEPVVPHAAALMNEPLLELEIEEPTLSEETTLSEPTLSPASTAKGFAPARGFAPPQAYPVVAPPRAAPVIMDVTPRGLGIATVAGFCEELIRRNSRLPAEMRRMFTTSRDAQQVVRIVVCQGESRRLSSNTVIGDLRLEDLPPRPRGETTIEVTFSLDASGILQVHARDPGTGREQRAALALVGGLGEQEVAASRDRLQQLRR